ncbi:hypothetical protein QFZ33_002503 [Arthrobacter globiformis]|nr:hypothetical protein [Arthrobacter globiformis]
MPIISNVAWDARLETFKGRDTAQYIESVMAVARRCAACGLPFGPGAALALALKSPKAAIRRARCPLPSILPSITCSASNPG